MRAFSIAGVQMSVSASTDNVATMETRIETIAHLYPWVQMVVFSELCAHGPLIERAEVFPCADEERFIALARKHRLWLIPGTLYEKDGERVYNTATVISPEGDIVGRYRKLFPFLPYEIGVEAGDEYLVWDIPDAGRFGLSICYDLWFPETARALACRGVEVIIHPSLTPTIDREVELSIARATAACQQCFVVDINGVGDGGNGRSIICGPAGDVVYQAGSAAELIPLELELGRVARSRERGLRGLGQPLKSFRDRTIDLHAPAKDAEYLQTLGPLRKPSRPLPGIHK